MSETLISMLRSFVVRRMSKMGSEDRSTGVLSLIYRLHASHLRHNFQSLLDSILVFKFQIPPPPLRNVIGIAVDGIVDAKPTSGHIMISSGGKHH